MRARFGFTLVELIVAGAILSLLLAALTFIFGRGAEAYRVNAEVGERQQVEETAIQMLRYDLTLAGYRTVQNYDTNDFSAYGNVTLEVAEGPPDSLLVRYYEDEARLFDAASIADALRIVTFAVDTVTNRLVRTDGSGFAVAEGVTNLEVLQYIGSVSGPSATPPVGSEELSGLELELTFASGSVRVFIIAFENRPEVTVY